MGDPIPLNDLFADVDLYKFDPWDLPGTLTRSLPSSASPGSVPEQFPFLLVFILVNHPILGKGSTSFVALLVI